ncbi:MAG TPA: hypothetical protein V6C52_15145 [Coleofasciculaceae cyanobacterium]|jgi:hypothetical protein
MLRVSSNGCHRAKASTPAISNAITVKPHNTVLSFAGGQTLKLPPIEQPPDIQDRMELYQGKLPNCQFLGALLMALQQDSQALSKLITVNEDNSYTVRFPGATFQPVIVHPEDFAPLEWRSNTKATQVKGHPEIRLIEAAYARLLQSLYPKRFKNLNPKPIRNLLISASQRLFPKWFGNYTPPSIRDVFRSPNFDPEFFTSAFAYKMLTGQDVNIYAKKDFDKLLKQESKSKFWSTKSPKVTFSDKPFETAQFDQIVLHRLKQAAQEPQKYSIALVSRPKGNLPKLNWLDWGETVRGYHVFVVDKVNAHEVTLRDPHNSRYGIVLPLRDTLEHFVKMYVVEKSPEPHEPA